MRLLTRALTGAVLATALAATLLTAPSPATASDAGAVARAAARPATGSCHALSSRELPQRSDPDAPVSCGRSHTGRTFLVPSVPRGVRMSDLDAVQRVVDRTCTPAYRRTVSTDVRQRLLSAYSYVWFAPTRQQVRQGARWVRCDVVVFGGSGSLVPLPPAEVPALRTAPHPDREARCYVGRRNLVTACSRPHQFRARTVYQLPRGAYPSEAELVRTGQRRCGPVAGRGWRTYNPSRADWRNGFRYVVCTSRTSR